jgi:hypothetical protein
VTALVGIGVLAGSQQHQIGRAKNNGVTAEELAKVSTHAAFYFGWPSACAGLPRGQGRPTGCCSNVRSSGIDERAGRRSAPPRHAASRATLRRSLATTWSPT